MNFENISGKKMALFAGGIIDNGDEYSFVSVSEIEELLHDLKKDIVKPLHDDIIIPETHIQIETLSSATPPSPEELILEYWKIIDKKITNDALILDENDLCPYQRILSHSDLLIIS